MHPNHSALCQLRGSFRDPLLSANDLPSSVRNIIDVFPVSAEQIIIVSDHSAHLLHVPRQTFLWNIFTAAAIGAAALAPDQPLLALALPEEIVIWDLSIGKIARRLVRPASRYHIGDLVFGPGGLLAVTTLNEGVHLWDISTHQLLTTFVDQEGWYLESFKSMAFSPGGQFLAIGHADGSDVCLWRTTDGQLQQTLFGHPWAHRIYGLAFTPDGKQLIGSEWSTDPDEESMPIWELPTGERIGKLPRMAWLPAVSPDGQLVASLNEEAFFLWNLAERKIIWQREDDVWGDKLIFDPEGQFLLIGGSNNTIQWRSIHDGQAVHILRGAALSQIPRDAQ